MSLIDPRPRADTPGGAACNRDMRGIKSCIAGLSSFSASLAILLRGVGLAPPLQSRARLHLGGCESFDGRKLSAHVIVFRHLTIVPIGVVWNNDRLLIIIASRCSARSSPAHRGARRCRC
jgi:hypothetical protein